MNLTTAHTFTYSPDREFTQPKNARCSQRDLKRLTTKNLYGSECVNDNDDLCYDTLIVTA